MLNRVGELVESCGQKWYLRRAETVVRWSVPMPYLTVPNRPSDSNPVSATGTEGGAF